MVKYFTDIREGGGIRYDPHKIFLTHPIPISMMNYLQALKFSYN